MNIFFLTYAHERGIRMQTGGIRKVRELGNALAKMGHRPAIFLPGDEYIPENDPARHEPYPVIRLPVLRPLSAYLAQFVMPLWFSRRSGGFRPDVVYFRTAPTVLPLLLSRLMKARFVIEINGDILGEERGKRARLWRDTLHYFRMRLTLTSERINCRGANAVVTLTEGLKRTVTGRYGIPGEKVFVIESGTNADHCRPLDPGECRRKFGMDPDQPCVTFIGVLYKHQGIDSLIDAAPLILEKYPETLFLIGGDGPTKNAWIEKAEAAGLSGAFRFMGVIPYERLPEFINTATVCAAPFSGNRGEASPLKVFDYMACGKPVVASDIPSLRPLIGKSGGILPVKPDDPRELASALIGLLGNEGERSRMGRNGRKYIEAHHRWDIIAGETVRALQAGAG
jgi:glycosyltransferase involved in cell wall biosynthesis